MKPTILALVALLFLASPALAENPPEFVTSSDDAQAIMRQVVDVVQHHYGLTLKYNLDVGVDSQADIDKVTRGPNHTGYHWMGCDGTHHIHALTGQRRDRVTEILVHEYGHAWQDENCPQPQEKVLAEGFSQWIAFKYLKEIGMSGLADGLFHKVDKDYVTGLNLLLCWERAYGQQGVLKLMRRVQSRWDVPEQPVATTPRPSAASNDSP